MTLYLHVDYNCNSVTITLKVLDDIQEEKTIESAIFCCNRVAYQCNKGRRPCRYQTEAPGALQTALLSRGIRMTRQRRVILEIIETASQHLDAAQILRKAVASIPTSIGLLSTAR